MRERIIKFLETENLSSAKFADDIGVQRSSISHILSGRNNPSFDFIQKILTKYKSLNAEWLIMGTGNMLKTIKQGNLFENDVPESIVEPHKNNFSEKISSGDPIIEEINSNESGRADYFEVKNKKSETAKIEKIITIYDNRTFDIYLPSK
jgi:transcriptional regulator with XRE-family HTH domain